VITQLEKPKTGLVTYYWLSAQGQAALL
jgi:hypothetical protein